MGRALLMCNSFCIGRFGQDPSSHVSQSRQLKGLQTQLLESPFQGGGLFASNEVLDYLSNSARKGTPALVLAPAKWTMGGGPRTYPGGMKKRQWKKHQKKDERKLGRQRLEREREIFETRRRQELRNIAPPAKSTLDRSVGSSDSNEEMLSLSHQHGSLPSRGSVLGANVVKDSTRGTHALGKAAEGGEVAENSQGGWTGSRMEVAEQIQKVREIVSNKFRRRAGTTEHETASSFSQLPLSPLTLKALTFILDIRNMTALQEATFPVILQGDDILAKTKVVGEDTIASLIYAIELVLSRKRDLPLTGIARVQQNLTVSGRSPITALIVCPTQECASFLASEAKLILMFHPSIRVQEIKGGNDIRNETRRLRSSPCQIVVATPGRLLNHIQNSPEFRGQLSGLRLFVLTNVQKLLSMGYRRTIERISRMLSRSRQTLLWSSSLPDEVLAWAETILKKNHQVISAYGTEDDEGSHQVVRHDFLVAPMESHLAMSVSILKAHVEKEPNYKVVVFCQTIRTTSFMSETFKKLGFFTCELHMRKNENHRERTAAVFRTMKDGVILFTCGASVWGVANLDVTLVLQIGQPAGREQYSRRVSLSGQETKERDCILMLMAHERAFLNELAAFPLRELAMTEVNPDTEAKVQHAVQQVDSLVRMKAYLAWLRYHVAKATSIPGKQAAVKLASIYCTVVGFERPPQLNARTIKAFGLQGVIDHFDDPQEKGRG